jgi:D-alanyl-D-alanine carboxypeptidase
MQKFNPAIGLLFSTVTLLFSGFAVANDKLKTICAPTHEFCSSIETLSDKQRNAMIGVVWQMGCPVPLNDLRVVFASHRTFKGSIALGSVVVHQQSAKAVQQALRHLFEANFPIESMIPIEAFGGDDERSGLANNTSAFNCRVVDGTRVFSQHAYGRAIDINPLQNPFVKVKDHVRLNTDKRFLDRAASAKIPGVITAQSVAVKAFKQIGWGWGGSWRGNKDYQHFSAVNR